MTLIKFYKLRLLREFGKTINNIEGEAEGKLHELGTEPKVHQF